jgi:hypothetical protein
MAEPIFIFHWTYGVCTALKISLTCASQKTKAEMAVLQTKTAIKKLT